MDPEHAIEGIDNVNKVAAVPLEMLLELKHSDQLM
jgi:hypothetical protein